MEPPGLCSVFPTVLLVAVRVLERAPAASPFSLPAEVWFEPNAHGFTSCDTPRHSTGHWHGVEPRCFLEGPIPQSFYSKEQREIPAVY